MLLRVIEKSRPPAPRRNSVCDYEDCREYTKAGKLYCTKHVEFLDYPQKVINEMRRREREIEMLSKGQSLPRNSHLIDEVSRMLLTSSYTSRALSKSLDISHESAERLIRQMSRRGLGRMSHTKKRRYLRISPKWLK